MSYPQLGKTVVKVVAWTKHRCKFSIHKIYPHILFQVNIAAVKQQKEVIEKENNVTMRI